MKKFLVLAALLFIGYSASAQFKISAGYLNSKVSFSESHLTASFDGNGFYVGGLYEAPISDIGLSIEPGVLFDYIKFKAHEMSTDIYYFRVPVHVNYSFEVADAATIFVGAGPSVVCGVGGSDDPFEDGAFKRFDLQLGAMAGVRFAKHFEVRAGYDWGVLKAADTDVKNHRNAFTVGLAYAF